MLCFHVNLRKWQKSTHMYLMSCKRVWQEKRRISPGTWPVWSGFNRYFIYFLLIYMSQRSIDKIDHFTVILLEKIVSRASHSYYIWKMSYTVTYENLEMICIQEKNKSKNLSSVNGIFFSVGTLCCVLLYVLVVLLIDLICIDKTNENTNYSHFVEWIQLAKTCAWKTF